MLQMADYIYNSAAAYLMSIVKGHTFELLTSSELEM